MSECSAIGLDVGGTNVRAGLVGFPSGVLLGLREFSTQAERGGEAVLDDALRSVASLRHEARMIGAGVLGIGIGVCELVDLNGNVTTSHAVPWGGMGIQDRVASLGLPAIVESDVRTAAVGEALFGAGRDHPVFAYVSVGTGISACLVIDGRPFAGAHGNAIILATGSAGLECPHCGTWAERSLEDYAAGPALARRYGEVERAEEVFAAANAGDRRAWDVLDSGGRALGHEIGLLVNLWDPNAVVIGGGLGFSRGPYWAGMLEGVQRTVWPPDRPTCPILPAQLGSAAGVIGAATTAWQRLCGDQGPQDGGVGEQDEGAVAGSIREVSPSTA
jgi:glucokinase